MEKKNRNIANNMKPNKGSQWNNKLSQKHGKIQSGQTGPRHLKKNHNQTKKVQTGKAIIDHRFMPMKKKISCKSIAYTV